VVVDPVVAGNTQKIRRNQWKAGRGTCNVTETRRQRPVRQLFLWPDDSARPPDVRRNRLYNKHLPRYTHLEGRL